MADLRQRNDWDEWGYAISRSLVLSLLAVLVVQCIANVLFDFCKCDTVAETKEKEYVLLLFA